MTPFLNLFRAKKAAPATVRFIDRDASTLRLHELRADDGMTAKMAQVLGDGRMQLAVSVLRNEHPAFNVLPPDAMEHVRAAQQAKCEGYTLCLANLLAMGRHEKASEELIADFAGE